MAASPKSESIIDIDQALTFTGGDPEMLLSVAELFSEEGPLQLQAIGQSIDDVDAAGIQRTAHQLKGSVVIFGADRTAKAALDVEMMARSGDLSEISNAWMALQSEMKKLFAELKELPDRLASSNEDQIK
ncbi:Hpt domain-containing protein [Stieleria marina]|uniref:Hpt domain-containing protein n=1 Tax=Stieleria marina TaxID=1930275 RepID=UPI003AF3B53D